MLSAPLPENELERLAALHELQILDTAPAPQFDDLTALAAIFCQTPIALVSLVDFDRQWFKSKHGLTVDQTSREVSFCAHAIHGEGVFTVADARLDPRFADNPLTTGSPNVRFYAGAPLIDRNGIALGTLCVIDHVPRELSTVQVRALSHISRQVSALLELHGSRADARRHAAEAGAFLASLRRELRAPLRGVVRSAQLLRESAMNADQQQLVALTRSAAEQVLATLDDMLDVAGSGRGNAPLDAAPFDLHELAMDSVVAARALGADRKVAVKLAWRSTRSPHRIGNLVGARKVLMRLLDTVIAAASSGAVILRISDGPSAQDVQFELRHDGADSADSMFSAIADVLRDDGQGATFAVGSLGIGLAMARRLLAPLGGELRTSSVPGSEPSLSFTLQMRPVGTVPSEASEPAAEVRALDGRSHTLHGLDVLLAESDAARLLLQLRSLNKAGARISVANSGPEALALCAERGFDLVLLDVSLDEIDGYETAAMIRRLPTPYAAIMPIVGMVDEVSPRERMQCLVSGMSECVELPLQQQALVGLSAQMEVAELPRMRA